MASRVKTRPRRKPRQERSRQTVDTILSAAAHVLVHDGYDRMSTNRIAEAAGVSIGSLYQYFPSKEALVAALIERHVHEITGAVSTAFAQLMDAPLAEAAAALVKIMIDMHAVDPALHRVLHDQVPRVGRLEQLHDVERRMMALTREYLERHRDELRPDLDLDLAVPILVQTVEVLSHSMVLRSSGLLHAPRLADEITELVVRYVTPTRPVEPVRRPVTRASRPAPRAPSGRASRG